MLELVYCIEICNKCKFLVFSVMTSSAGTSTSIMLISISSRASTSSRAMTTWQQSWFTPAQPAWIQSPMADLSWCYPPTTMVMGSNNFICSGVSCLLLCYRIFANSNSYTNYSENQRQHTHLCIY